MFFKEIDAKSARQLSNNKNRTRLKEKEQKEFERQLKREKRTLDIYLTRVYKEIKHQALKGKRECFINMVTNKSEVRLALSTIQSQLERQGYLTRYEQGIFLNTLYIEW